MPGGKAWTQEDRQKFVQGVQSSDIPGLMDKLKGLFGSNPSPQVTDTSNSQQAIPNSQPSPGQGSMGITPDQYQKLKSIMAPAFNTPVAPTNMQGSQQELTDKYNLGQITDDEYKAKMDALKKIQGNM